MNYRHAYHAGNVGDVLKHLVLVSILRRLLAKEKPFSYLETHAGRGLYDLQGVAARRSGEAAHGVLRLAGAARPPQPVRQFLDLLRALPGNEHTLRWYPGSPLLARALLREQDRALVMELNPEEARVLAKRLAGDRRVQVQCRDGWAALDSLLPPTPRRGLLLIDPPYESDQDMHRMLKAIAGSARRWPVGIVAGWYPIKRRQDLRAFYEAATAAAPAPLLRVELCPLPDDLPARMNGSGLLVYQPPWQLDRDIQAWLPWVAEAVTGHPAHRATVDWLGPET